jgi:hypothetical protein
MKNCHQFRRIRNNACPGRLSHNDKIMRIVIAIMLFTATLSFVGCAFGPSGEEQDRQAIKEEDAADQSEQFARSLPPAR